MGQGPIFVLSLVFVLGLVVIVHELGHYLAARAFGGAAESFSVGFGRSIVEVKDKRNTRWRLNWIPFGGFVKFVGESQLPGDVGRVEEGPIGKKFMDMSVGQRSVVAVAGPMANFVLAVIIFAVMAMIVPDPIERVTIRVLPDGPAKEAGFEVGDQLVAINDRTIDQFADVRRMISLSTGETLSVRVLRDGQEHVVDVVPVRMEIDNGLGQVNKIGAIGARMEREVIGTRSYAPHEALGHGVSQTAEVISLTANMIVRMATGREPLSQLSGPVGIGDLTRRAVTNTLEVEEVPLSVRLRAIALTLLQISAFVSVGIGLFNLLPLPVLDGGHLVFNAYEALTGSVLSARIQEISLTFGAVLLLSIAVLVTVGDIVKTGVFQSLGG